VLAMTTSPTRTSKTPLRGLSALTVIVTPSSAASIPSATLAARVVNARHDLHASISMVGNSAVVPPARPKPEGSTGAPCAVGGEGAGWLRGDGA